MARFCGKCGTALNEEGLCPKCDLEITEKSAPAVNTVKEKKQKPKALTVVITVFLSLCLFLTMFPVITICSVRCALDGDQIERSIEKMLSAEVSDGTAFSDFDYDDFSQFAEEAYGVTLNRRELEQLLERSEVKEYISEEIAEFCEDILEGEGEIRLTKREFIEALEKDARMIEREFGAEVDNEAVYRVADEIFEEESYYLTVDEVLSELEQSPEFGSYDDARRVYRILSAVFSFSAMMIFVVLSLVIIGLMAINSLSQCAVGTGVVFIVWGSLYGFFSLILLWVSSIMEAIFSNAVALALFGNFVSAGVVTGLVMLAFGIALLILRKILKKRFAAKSAAA